MSIQAPQGILNIPNAILRVGKLSVDEVVGADTILNTVARNTILLVDDEAYHENKNWALKLPNAWAGEFECNTASAGNYSEFNFYNEGASSNAQGYNLTFNDTAVELRYDGTLLKTGTLASTITGTGVKKVRLMFERTILSVTVDGTLVFTHDDTVGPRPRVYSTTAGGFLNFFTDGGAIDNLKIVNEKWMSDGTSNIAYVGGGEVAVGKALAFNRVSNVSQIKVDSNVVTEYTGPHDRPLRKYPEIILPRAAVGADYNGYRIERSSEYVTGPYLGVQSLFNNTAVDYADTWGAGINGTNFSYSASTGEHTAYVTGGTTQGTAARLASNVPNGEWVSLKSPNAIKLDNIQIRSRNASDWFAQFPTDFQIWGSNDGTTWSHIKTFTGQSASGQSILHTYHINSTIFYNRHALVVTKIPGETSSGANDGAAHLSISELRFNGHEEGSGSLDTTLKSVYNVPATTGTQLEVYYDAKNYTSGTITDESPNSYVGTLNGNTQLETVDGIKAFTFDGNGDTITGTVSGASGEYVHSIVFWIKFNDFSTANTGYTLFEMGARSQDDIIGLYAEPGKVNYYFYSNDNSYSLNGVSSGNLIHDQWYHFTATYSGGSDLSNRKLYINGNEIPRSTHGGASSGALTLANGNFTIGDIIGGNGLNDFAGSIANFRLYSKALNADQVKELYDYQKDYFLGSKSQVTLYKGHLGVGVTEPSGQLELAGDERIQEYPPRGMTGFDTYIEGHGVFTASASSVFSSAEVRQAYQAFNGGIDLSNDDAWISKNDRYTSGLPNANAALINGVAGEWLGIQFPYPIKLKQIAIQNRGGGYNDRSPDSGILWGSNDGTEYEQVVSWSGLSFVASGSTPSYVTINTTNTYRFFRLQGTKVVNTNTSDFLAIGELKFFGTPGPTTLDKGSLSLTRSLDVPRISRYDVDTETPRPEKLVVDFDTTVNSSPTDISGQGNHGTLVGATYSAADKAFNFDGTDDYIDIPSVSGVGTGAWVHSKSFWFKLHSSTDPGILFLLGRNGSTRQIAVQVNGSGQFQYFIYGCNSRVQVNGSDWFPDVNRWYHCVTVFRNNETTADGSVLTGREMYIDGVKQTLVAIGNQIALDLDSSEVRFGNQFNSNYLDYELSNPKLYSVALEPSEVQKLYRLGRTGRSMVISDTAVGIGKVPEAQLDVRGVIKGTGALTTGLPWFYARNQTQLTTGSTSYNVTSTHLQESNDALGTMYSTSYACLFPIKGIYIFSAQVHSVFGSAHNATFDGVVRYSNGGQYYNVYSPTKIGPTVVNYDTHASCIFIITAIEDGMYLELNHITSASVQRNYNGQWNRNWGVCIYAL